MIQKSSISGLVPIPQRPDAAISVKEVDSMFSRIAAPRSPLPDPASVIPAEKVPWRLTASVYSRSGTVVNRLTAKKPLRASIAACGMFPPRPEAYSIPHSNPDTTRLNPYRVQPRREKNNTTTCTHSRSNSSPHVSHLGKKAPRKPTIWL